METVFTLTSFTPGEAEKITGVSTTRQRDLRRHGLLPSSDGHARFTGFSLAELLALKLLMDRGIGPQQGSLVVNILGCGIMLYALKHRDAYEGESRNLLPETKIEVPDDLRRQLEAKLAEDRPGEKFDLSAANLGWIAKADKLGRAILSEYGTWEGAGRVIPARFFIWFADGTHRWDESVDKCFSRYSEATRGAVLVLDQFSIARELVERAGRPLVYVEDTEEYEQ